MHEFRGLTWPAGSLSGAGEEKQQESVTPTKKGISNCVKFSSRECMRKFPRKIKTLLWPTVSEIRYVEE